ncbi:MAG: hypothetical protein ACRYGP_08110 [Janthinobacterium lividum]
MIRHEALHDTMPVFTWAGLGHAQRRRHRRPLGARFRAAAVGGVMLIHLKPDDIEHFTAAAEARADDLMDSATASFRAMVTAAREGDRDGVAASAVVVADTCLQVCVIPAKTWEGADNKARFLRLMIPWAWPRHPALGAVLEAVSNTDRLPTMAGVGQPRSSG